MYKRKNNPTTLLLATVLLACSCEKSIIKETYELILPSDYGKTLAVPDHKFIMAESLGGTTVYGQAPVFGDIYSIAGIPATKAGITLSEIPFVDLLDINRIEEQCIDGISVTQIPFKTSIDYQEMALQYTDEEMQWTSSKRYFVFTEIENEYMSQIVTLIPTTETLEHFGPNSFSFLNRSRFDGLMIYSDLDGIITDAISNKESPIHFGKLTSIDETDSTSVKLAIPIYTETKSILGDKIGNGHYADNIIECVFIDNKNEPIYNPKDGNNTPGHGNYDNDNQNEENKTEDKLADDGRDIRPGSSKIKDPTLYYINISIYGEGDVSGAGAFTKGYNTLIKANGKNNFAFIRWEGDFKGKDDRFSVTVNKNMTADAVFQDNKSCYDKEKDINAVINSTTIAKTKVQSIIGGTFGWTRKKELKDTLDKNGNKIYAPRFHKGLDFLAEPGTPVFAPGNGKIILIIDTIKNEEVKESERWKNAGNRIWLQTDDGAIYKYFHLRAPEDGGAIASGISQGSRVIRGQLIGYSGKTGNAFSDIEVPNKHLHLEVWVNNKAQDPANYINGIVNTQTGTIIVKCDNEYETNHNDDFIKY